MTPRTLWTILLKIAGLYIFLQLLYALPSLIITGIVLTDQNDSGKLAGLSYLFFSISISLFMLIAFIFRTDWLIRALRLDKTITEEKLELNIHRSIILKIAIIVTGGLLLIETLPLLLKEVFNYFQVSNLYNGFKRYSRGGWIIFHVLKLLISYFMVTSSRLIVNFIERKRKGSEIV